MKSLKVSKAYKISLALIVGLLIGISGDTLYQHLNTNHFRIISTRQISASSSLYRSVKNNDLEYLHKIGNKNAEQANIDYALSIANKEQGNEINSGDTNASDNNSASNLSKKFLKAHMKYQPDKDGNYWSYFEDHQPIMSDNYDFGNAEDNANSTNNDNNTEINPHSKFSGMLANEKVLENHGVTTGINFSYWTKG